MFTRVRRTRRSCDRLTVRGVVSNQLDQFHRASGFCFQSQMIQSTFLGSPPSSLSLVMHWPRWCCECIATCTRASATVITQGGSGNQGTVMVCDSFSGWHRRDQVAQACVTGLSTRFQVIERLGRPWFGFSGLLVVKHGQEAELHASQMAEATAHLLIIAGRRTAPGVEENRVGPFGVSHQIAQEFKHRKKLHVAVLRPLKYKRWSARIATTLREAIIYLS